MRERAKAETVPLPSLPAFFLPESESGGHEMRCLLEMGKKSNLPAVGLVTSVSEAHRNATYVNLYTVAYS